MGKMNSQSNFEVLAITSTAEVNWTAQYRELLPKLFHYFAYRLGDEQLAEDLTASTFERAWRHRKRYRSDLGKFQAWLFGIARKVTSEHLRKRRGELPLEAAYGVQSGVSVEQAQEAKSDFRRLAALLGGLTERERELVALKYGGEMTNRTIAELTGLSESNVGTILHRLVQKLRKEWEQSDD